MENKVSDVIVEFISKSNYEEEMKKFLIQILEFELKYQIQYEETDSQGSHKYADHYKEIIKSCVGENNVSTRD